MTPIPLARACNKPRARSGRSPRHRVGARPQSVLLPCDTRCMAGQFLGGDSTRHRRRAGEPRIAGRVSAAAIRHQGYLNHPRYSSQTRGNERDVPWRGSWRASSRCRATLRVSSNLSADGASQIQRAEAPGAPTGEPAGGNRSVHPNARDSRLGASSQTPVDLLPVPVSFGQVDTSEW